MFRKTISLIVAIAFVFSLVTPLPKAQAQGLLGLPEPGTMVSLSPAYQPAIIKGLTIHKDNPFLFDFIVDVGQDHLQGRALKKEGEKLIKYFLASLAIPEKDLWVNLSPYEKDRIIPQALGQTDMGRDLLAQDYMLKQITASLIYPEKNLGKTFWDKVYAAAQAKFGTTQIPVNTFNKVWIMADEAEVFERNQTVFVVTCHLKVMLEEDYLAMQKHSVGNGKHNVVSQIIREIILPRLETEVNTGKNFANLRQIFNSIILSSWYRNNLKQALLNQVYTDKEKVKGIDLQDKNIKEQIYQRYLQAYKKGVFNYIKNTNSPNGESVPRKYFSGGIDEAMAAHPGITTNPQQLDSAMSDVSQLVTILAGMRTGAVARAVKKLNRGILALPARLQFASMVDSEPTFNTEVRGLGNWNPVFREKLMENFLEGIKEGTLSHADFNEELDYFEKNVEYEGIDMDPTYQRLMRNLRIFLKAVELIYPGIESFESSNLSKPKLSLEKALVEATQAIDGAMIVQVGHAIEGGARIEVYPTKDGLAVRIARRMADILKENNTLGMPTLFILPTGNTAIPIHDAFAKIVNEDKINCLNLMIVNMDEYGGTEIYHDFMREHLFSKIKGQGFVDNYNHVLFFNGFADDPEAELLRFDKRLEEMMSKTGGVIHLEVGGIGVKAHVAFNEAPKVISRGENIAALLQKPPFDWWEKNEFELDNTGTLVSRMDKILELRQKGRKNSERFLNNAIPNDKTEASRAKINILANRIKKQTVTFRVRGLKDHFVSERTLKSLAEKYGCPVKVVDAEEITKSKSRVVQLSISTILANAGDANGDFDKMPTWAYTIGLGTVLSPQEKMIAATGTGKAWAIEKATQTLSSEYPAAILSKDPNTTFVVDTGAAAELDKSSFRELDMTYPAMIDLPIAFTGATGFLGSGLSEALKKSGAKPRALVWNKAEEGKLAQMAPDFEHVTGALIDVNQIEALVHGEKTLIHLAADTRTGVAMDKKEAADILTTNILGAGVALLAAENENNEGMRKIFISSFDSTLFPKDFEGWVNSTAEAISDYVVDYYNYFGIVKHNGKLVVEAPQVYFSRIIEDYTRKFKDYEKSNDFKGKPYPLSKYLMDKVLENLTKRRGIKNVVVLRIMGPVGVDMAKSQAFGVLMKMITAVLNKEPLPKGQKATPYYGYSASSISVDDIVRVLMELSTVKLPPQASPEPLFLELAGTRMYWTDFTTPDGVSHVGVLSIVREAAKTLGVPVKNLSRNIDIQYPKKVANVEAEPNLVPLARVLGHPVQVTPLKGVIEDITRAVFEAKINAVVGDISKVYSSNILQDQQVSFQNSLRWFFRGRSTERDLRANVLSILKRPSGATDSQVRTYNENLAGTVVEKAIEKRRELPNFDAAMFDGEGSFHIPHGDHEIYYRPDHFFNIEEFNNRLNAFQRKVSKNRNDPELVVGAVIDFEEEISEFTHLPGGLSLDDLSRILDDRRRMYQAVNKVLVKFDYLAIEDSEGQNYLSRIKTKRKYYTAQGPKIVLFVNVIPEEGRVDDFKNPYISLSPRLNVVVVDHFEPSVKHNIMPLLDFPQKPFFIERPIIGNEWIGAAETTAIRKFFKTFDYMPDAEFSDELALALAYDYVLDKINSKVVSAETYEERFVLSRLLSIARGNVPLLSLALLLDDVASARVGNLKPVLRRAGLSMDAESLQVFVRRTLNNKNIKPTFKGYYTNLAKQKPPGIMDQFEPEIDEVQRFIYKTDEESIPNAAMNVENGLIEFKSGKKEHFGAVIRVLNRILSNTTSPFEMTREREVVGSWVTIFTKKSYFDQDAIIADRLREELGLSEQIFPNGLDFIVNRNNVFNLHETLVDFKEILSAGNDKVSNFAMINDHSDETKLTARGGIDLNTGKTIWTDRKEGSGVEMKVDPAMVARVRREGIDRLDLEIYSITPVVSIWPLIGLEQPSKRILT